ncbi:MAG: glycoside hydrolase family 31 protein [Byssovorax sp.]
MRKLLVPLSLLLVAACDLPPPGGTTDPGSGTPAPATLDNGLVHVEIRTDPFGLEVTDPAGKVLLDTFDGDSTVASDEVKAYGPLGATHHTTDFKISVVEGWDHVIGTDDPWHHGAEVTALGATGTSASIDLADPSDAATTFHVDLSLDGPELRIDAAVTGGATSGAGGSAQGGLNQMGLSFVLPEDEHFFGLGERLSAVDHRGRHYECWVEEGGIGQGEGVPPGPDNPGPNGPGMSHAPIPFYVSTRGYGLFLDTGARTGFSLGADDPGLFRVYAEEPALHLRVMVHDDPKDTLAHYTRLTGRPRLPAPWVFGPRRRVNRGALINGVPEPQALRDAKVPVTVLDDAAHFLPIGTEVGHEQEFAQYNQSLHDLGYKADAYYNPYISVTNPATKDLVDYGRKHGYFVKLDDGTEFDTLVVSSGPQTVATIDLTNPEAVIWYHTLLQKALDLGYDGWMLDFGEYIPQRAVMHDGTTGWTAHNRFPVVYTQAVFDYLRSVRGDDFMFFARAGYAGSQAYTPVLWSGDPAASYDNEKGLPAQVRAGVNAGLSGFPFWGSDIGGYGCFADPPPDKEVLLRWVEFGALSTDMHDEDACAAKPEGSPPKWTLWNDAESTEVWGRYSRLHTRLFPYLYAAAREATLTGLPVMRHPILAHPGEPEAAKVELEYYFGASLYVAPVVRRGAVKRDLWLPPGRWFDFWSLAPHAGNAMITRDAPLDVLPLFLRSGGIVAMLDPEVETLAPEQNPNVVGMADRAGVLDVRAALDPKTHSAHAELVDGTVFDLTLDSTKLSLPVKVSTAKDDAELSTCSLCGKIDAVPGGATRFRLTTAGAGEEQFTAGALTLRHHALSPIRIRWDVVVGDAVEK